MKTLKFYSLLLLALMLTVGTRAQGNDAEKPTIVFVHGVWADGSCWADEIAARN